jgi:hypothetical protein
VIGTVRDPVRKANASRCEFHAFNPMPHFEKKRRCAQPKVEVPKSKRGSKVEVDVTMRVEVKVNQFDILYINREHALSEQFPLRVQFLADASKNVAAKCENFSRTLQQHSNCGCKV